MTVAEATAKLAALREFSLKARSASVVLGAEVKGSYELRRLQLGKALAKDFRNIAVAALHDDGQEVVRPYDPGYKLEPHERCYATIASLGDSGALAAQIEDLAAIELFAASDDFIRKLKFYAVVLGKSDQHAILLRTYSPRMELSSKGIVAILQKGVYNALEERAFLFDRDIDCVVWDGVVFVRSVSRFHQIFRYFDRIRAQAAANFDAIVSHVPISNLEAFKQAATSQPQMIAKMAQIAGRGYLTSVTFEDLERTIGEFSLEIPIQNADDGSKQLLFEAAPDRRWLILRLLDDAYLRSVMTEARYEVNSKSTLPS